MFPFSRDFLGLVFFPDQTLRKRREYARPAARGMAAVVSIGGLYALSSLALAVSGAVPLAPVPFGIPGENYYFWQMILFIPGVLLAWLMAGGLVRLFGRGGEGAFREAAALSGPALAAPLVFCWIPQAVQAVLMILGMGQEEFVGIVSVPGIWQTLYIGFHVAGLALAVVLFAVASRVSQPMSRLMAGLRGCFAAAVLATVHVLFVR